MKVNSLSSGKSKIEPAKKSESTARTKHQNEKYAMKLLMVFLFTRDNIVTETCCCNLIPSSRICWMLINIIINMISKLIQSIFAQLSRTIPVRTQRCDNVL